MPVSTLLVLGVWVYVAVGQLPDVEDPEPLDPAHGAQQSHIKLMQKYAHIAKDNNKLAVFIAAAVGTMTLMGVVYCIYNQFYTKYPYTEVSLDMRERRSSSVFPGFMGQRAGWMERGRGGYGSLSDSPSIITLPPSLSPPPCASALPPLSLSRPAPLRTISAQDLERSFL